MTVRTESAERHSLRALLVENGAEGESPFADSLLGPNAAKELPGIDVHLAGSMASAIQAIRRLDPFDVILLNLDLSDCSGKATFFGINDVAGDQPIIVLGEEADRGLALELVQSGAQDFLMKRSLTPGLMWRSMLFATARHARATERAADRLALARIHAALENERDESSQLRKQLIHADRLEALGRLAAGVAHEIRNPLAMLQMGIDYFDAKSNRDDVTEQKMLKIMQEALLRGDLIVTDMVDFAKPRDMKFEAQDVGKMVRRAIEFVGPELKRHDIKIKLDLGANLPKGRADRDKIGQVLVNLLVNAIHASEKGAEIEVSTSLIAPHDLLTDPGERKLQKVRTEHEILALTVRDHGSGIPNDKLDKIFDPFFTTKATNVGTGLGLAVSKTIVELHNGRLRIKNAEPQGVRAEVFLQPWRGE